MIGKTLNRIAGHHVLLALSCRGLAFVEAWANVKVCPYLDRGNIYKIQLVVCYQCCVLIG